MKEVARQLVDPERMVPELVRELGVPADEARGLYEQAVRVIPHVDATVAPTSLDRAQIERALVFDLTKPDPAVFERAKREGRPVQLAGDNRYKSRNRMTQFHAAVAEGRIEDALAHGERALALAPDDAEHHYFFGGFLGQIGLAERALEHLLGSPRPSNRHGTVRTSRSRWCCSTRAVRRRLAHTSKR